MVAIRGEDFEKLGINITPSDSKDSVQGASYDFRIGDQIWLMSEQRIMNPKEEQVMLRRNDIAIIQTYETIKMPQDVCGFLVNKVALHAMGIFHPATSIDPIFEGHMQVALFNMGRYDVPLKYKEDLCTAMFFTTTGPTEIHHKREQDFSRLIEVFASQLNIMIPERPENVPTSVSLDELKGETVWRGNPYISMYSFMAGHERQLADLKEAVKSHFLLLNLSPWFIAIVIFSSLMTLSSLSWEQVEPTVKIISIIIGLYNIVNFGLRWWRGRRLK